MVLQPLLSGLWLRTRSPGRSAPQPPSRRGYARAAGAVLWLLVAGLGMLLARSASGTYLGLLLAWSGPLLALQWAAGGDTLWAQRRLLTVAAAPPTLYLCAVDRLGLHLRLWQLSDSRTTGVHLLGLPLEEALFFLLTTLLVVGGLLLGTDQVTLARLRSRLPRGQHPSPKPVPAEAGPSGARSMMSLQPGPRDRVGRRRGPQRPRRPLHQEAAPGRGMERAAPASADPHRAGARSRDPAALPLSSTGTAPWTPRRNPSGQPPGTPLIQRPVPSASAEWAHQPQLAAGAGQQSSPWVSRRRVRRGRVRPFPQVATDGARSARDGGPDGRTERAWSPGDLPAAGRPAPGGASHPQAARLWPCWRSASGPAPEVGVWAQVPHPALRPAHATRWQGTARQLVGPRHTQPLTL